MRACAREPARSSPARRLSKSMEGVISLMISAGPDSNRPPHILLVSCFSPEGPSRTKKIADQPRRPVAAGTGRSIWDRPATVHARAATARPAGGAEAGKPAKPPPRWRSPMPRAARHALADFKGRYVLLNLWATWCAPCVAELPALARLKAAVPGLTVLAVDVGHDKADAAAPSSRATMPARWAPLSTPRSPCCALRRCGLPTTVLIDPNGKDVGQRRRARRMGVAGRRSPISRI